MIRLIFILLVFSQSVYANTPHEQLDNLLKDQLFQILVFPGEGLPNDKVEIFYPEKHDEYFNADPKSTPEVSAISFALTEELIWLHVWDTGHGHSHLHPYELVSFSNQLSPEVKIWAEEKNIPCLAEAKISFFFHGTRRLIFCTAPK